MPEIPENAKKPADRKKKKDDDSEVAFSFTAGGETYTLKPTYDVVTPGFLRANRRREEVDAFFTMLEALAPDEDTLDAVDNMSRSEFQQLMKDFYRHLEVASTGE